MGFKKFTNLKKRKEDVFIKGFDTLSNRKQQKIYIDTDHPTAAKQKFLEITGGYVFTGLPHFQDLLEKIVGVRQIDISKDELAALYPSGAQIAKNNELKICIVQLDDGSVFSVLSSTDEGQKQKRQFAFEQDRLQPFLEKADKTSQIRFYFEPQDTRYQHPTHDFSQDRAFLVSQNPITIGQKGGDSKYLLLMKEGERNASQSFAYYNDRECLIYGDTIWEKGNRRCTAIRSFDHIISKLKINMDYNLTHDSNYYCYQVENLKNLTSDQDYSRAERFNKLEPLLLMNDSLTPELDRFEENNSKATISFAGKLTPQGMDSVKRQFRKYETRQKTVATTTTELTY